ncbi:MAG: penicillin-binding protein, partial [Erysipelotrichia bacterium]|nr:penicillin-binding protein [Erysipelotrichia bacterium]
YANMNYYGDGYWGIEEAAEGYYGVSASDLTVAESAMLAGIPNAPALYQLSTGYDEAKKRQEKVLGLMLNNEYISEDIYNEAMKENTAPIEKQK